MYFYIMCFQVVCILASGFCLYLAVTDERLHRENYGMAALAALSGIFLMEIGYGLYLQEITLAGLRVAERICLFGKLLSGIGFFVTCVSLSEKDSRIVKMLASVLGLTAGTFLFSENFYRLLCRKQEFLQNQFFYYIETEWATLGKIFHGFIRCLPIFGIFWFVICRKKKRRPAEIFLAAGIFLWAASTACQKLAFLRHYDADMPFGAALALCLIFFVAWNTKKVYTTGG